jgi:hypothetical protein
MRVRGKSGRGGLSPGRNTYQDQTGKHQRDKYAHHQQDCQASDEGSADEATVLFLEAFEFVLTLVLILVHGSFHGGVLAQAAHLFLIHPRSAAATCLAASMVLAGCLCWRHFF